MATSSKVSSLLKINKKAGHFMLTRLMSIECKQLFYQNFGDPASVVEIKQTKLESPQKAEVLIKFLAAPINPADINTIQGVYPVKPPFPATPGNEGVAEVVETGESVRGLKPGDWVVPSSNAFGTWRTHAICDETKLQKIAPGLDVVAAATISVNPCTAYRMLKDFGDLQCGDTIIQNGANSACGQAVIQLCKEWGIQSVNIVRNRPNISEVTNQLKDLGADYVVTEEDVPNLSIFKTEVKRPKLALNCVGGKNALNMMRHLDKAGTMVTYGGMSREPVTVPTSALIFKDISIRGYWMTQWNIDNAGSSDHVVMLSEITSLSKKGKLKPPPHELVSLEDYKAALSKAMNHSGKSGVKYLFNLSK